jgi:D-amino-acid oxidase
MKEVYMFEKLVILKTVLFLTLGSNFAIAAPPEITNKIQFRQINPPKLDKAHLGKHILCHRPMRQGSPEMRVEKQGDKLIAHNYGHGGSGWTLGPGAAEYVIGLLEKQMQDEKLSKNTPIAVIGAGALGLLSALELVNHGYKNVTVVAKSFDNLTSHNAGGLLAPVSMDNNPKMQKLIDKIGINAYIFYKRIAEGKDKVIQKGARIVPTYFENREESGLEPYVGKVMKPANDVILDFKNGTMRKMVAYDDGIFMDTGSLMASLKKALTKKVRFKTRKINDLSELLEKVVVNCTGNGAKTLINDPKMISVQGHLVMLKDQTPSDVEYMILVYFGKDKTKAGFDVKRSFYIFPKTLPGTRSNDVGVIGGTFIEGADANTPNSEEFEIMLTGARKFYGINH